MEHGKNVGLGDRVQARTAEGDWITLRALGAPQFGENFPVVWVCEEARWKGASADAADGIPWPADEIVVAGGADEQQKEEG